MLFSHTALGKSGSSSAAIAQSIGFRLQVSDFGCQGTEVLSPDTWNLQLLTTCCEKKPNNVKILPWR